MPRYIDADYVLSKIGEYAMHPNEELVNNLAIAFDIVVDAPTVDAVSVVRCKECKYYDKFPTWAACTYWNGDPYEQASVNADDFCSYGERKTDHE